MDINFDLLRTFKIVAHHGSISKAAKILCVTQPSITKAIKKLEQQLNMTLFVRDKKGMILTDNGKTLYRYIVDPINTLESVELIAKNIKITDIGKLRIGAGDSVTKNLLKQTIIDYKKLHPGITLEISNKSSEDLYDDLRYGKVDIIFINSTIIINEHKYRSFKLLDIEDCFFANKELYEKVKNISNLKSILSENLITQNERHDTRSFLDSICIRNNIQLKPTIELDRHNLIVEFVKEGLGIGFATKQYIKKELSSGILYELNVNFNIQKRFIKGVYRTNNDVKVKNFINLLIKNNKDND